MNKDVVMMDIEEESNSQECVRAPIIISPAITSETASAHVKSVIVRAGPSTSATPSPSLSLVSPTYILHTCCYV